MLVALHGDAAHSLAVFDMEAPPRAAPGAKRDGPPVGRDPLAVRVCGSRPVLVVAAHHEAAPEGAGSGESEVIVTGGEGHLRLWTVTVVKQVSQ